MELSCEIQPVSVLYDLQREYSDGRKFEDYVQWLAETIRIFPNMYIFCDQIPEQFRGINSINWIVKKKESLYLWNSLDKVTKICDEMRKSSSDLTYQLPSYGILQFSKFEMLAEMSKSSVSENLLWVDAGISRFLRENYLIDVGHERYLRAPKFSEALFEVDLHKNVRFGRMRKVRVGSSRRTFSGTSFLLKKSFAQYYFDTLTSKAESWIAENKWDNEQVGLNSCYIDGSINPNFLNQIGSTGTIARVVLNSDIEDNVMLNKKALRRTLIA